MPPLSQRNEEEEKRRKKTEEEEEQVGGRIMRVADGTKRKRGRGDDPEVASMDHITQRVKRLHAFNDQNDHDPGILPGHAHADPSSSLYLRINQVLRDLHFDRLKRLRM
jgi:hypothetical protein